MKRIPESTIMLLGIMLLRSTRQLCPLMRRSHFAKLCLGEGMDDVQEALRAGDAGKLSLYSLIYVFLAIKEN